MPHLGPSLPVPDPWSLVAGISTDLETSDRSQMRFTQANFSRVAEMPKGRPHPRPGNPPGKAGSSQPPETDPPGLTEAGLKLKKTRRQTPRSGATESRAIAARHPPQTRRRLADIRSMWPFAGGHRQISGNGVSQDLSIPNYVTQPA